MKILGLEKVSFVDYQDHISATVFLGGCNFLCPFCHNNGIVKQAYSQLDTDEVLNYLSSRTKLLDGIVVSGGEPTLQNDLPEFIKKIKEMGYLVKLDTNGTNPEMLKNLISQKLVDYVAMDIKNDFENYDKITGVISPPIEKIKQSLLILKESGISYELRTTLVKEFHTSETVENMGKSLAGHKQIYLQKYVSSENCINSNLTPVSKDEATVFQNILQKYISQVSLRGY